MEDQYLAETFYFNHSHFRIQELINGLDSTLHQKEKAIQLYLKVRDGWRYNAYSFHTPKSSFQSSDIARRTTGHCLDKAILLIACFRGAGLPARLHLAKVRNHIAAEKIIEIFDTDELTPHGFVEVFLNEQWVSCTPAFNRSLCEKLNVDVLEFDGESNSIFQEYSRDGGQFMEYLEDYGIFSDFPYDFVLENMDQHYPKFKEIRKKKEVFSL